jgi:hypothetical protein
MSRIGLAALVFVVTLVAQRAPRVEHSPPPDESTALQGAWEIVSVTRDGETDPTDVGGSITFWDDGVWFHSKAERAAAAAAAWG